MTEAVGSRRLSLRRATIDEALALVQEPGREAKSDAHLCADDGTRHFALRMLERNPEETDEFAMYHIVEEATGSIVGHVGLHGRPDDCGHVRIGYAIAAAFRGSGYATEAVAAILAWIASHPDVSVVDADTDDANLASQRVLEKNGFALTQVVGATRFYHRARVADSVVGAD